MSICKGITSKKSPCKKRTNDSSGFCHLHKPKINKKLVPLKITPVVTKPAKMEKEKSDRPTAGIFVGCSGYDYDFWCSKPGEKNFFPEETKRKERFDFYASQFNCLEINSTFYGTPSQKTWKAWKERAERTNHKYIVKVTKHITHSKKLCDFKETWERFWDNSCELLEDTLLCVLFQFSPSFRNTKQNRSKLAQASKVLRKAFAGKRPDIAFEFRDKSWFDDETVDSDFERRNWILVCPMGVNHRLGKEWIGNTPNFGISDVRVTCSSAYIRLHGNMGPYIGTYSDEFIKELAEFAKMMKDAGVTTYFFFNNTDSPWYYCKENIGKFIPFGNKTHSAVYNARALQKLV